MKVKVTRPKKFEPVETKVTFESAEELAATMRVLGNLNKHDSQKIYDTGDVQFINLPGYDKTKAREIADRFGSELFTTIADYFGEGYDI